MSESLPLIDEHRREIAAAPADVWDALLAGLERSRGSAARAATARLLGCAETTPNARNLDEVGATLPGFAVVAAEPRRRLTMHGRHRFSRYALEFELEPRSSQTTLLTARTRAIFPGVVGAAYRRLVIGTRLHVVAVRSTLRAVQRRAHA